MDKIVYFITFCDIFIGLQIINSQKYRNVIYLKAELILYFYFYLYKNDIQQHMKPT